jgi:hypothetical protein
MYQKKYFKYKSKYLNLKKDSDFRFLDKNYNSFINKTKYLSFKDYNQYGGDNGDVNIPFIRQNNYFIRGECPGPARNAHKTLDKALKEAVRRNCGGVTEKVTDGVSAFRVRGPKRSVDGGPSRHNENSYIIDYDDIKRGALREAEEAERRAREEALRVAREAEEAERRAREEALRVVREAEEAERRAREEEERRGRLPLLYYDPRFFEPQESLGCGRHALNNLLGGRYFIKDDRSVFTLDSIKIPISLQSLCRFLSNELRIFETLECLEDENYDTNVLRSALNILGFPVEQKTRETIEDNPEIFGFIVNYGGGHWVSLRRLDDGNYKYTDSVSGVYPIINEGMPDGKIGLDTYIGLNFDRISQILEIRHRREGIDPLEYIREVTRSADERLETAQNFGEDKKAVERLFREKIGNSVNTALVDKVIQFINNSESQEDLDIMRNNIILLDNIKLERCLKENQDTILGLGNRSNDWQQFVFMLIGCLSSQRGGSYNNTEIKQRIQKVFRLK